MKKATAAIMAILAILAILAAISILHETVPEEDIALGVTIPNYNEEGIRITQSSEEQIFLSFEFWATREDRLEPGGSLIPGIQYTNFRLSWEQEGNVVVQNLHMLVHRPGCYATSFVADGESDAPGDGSILFLQNKTIESISQGSLVVSFQGIVQGTGKRHYTLTYDALDAFGHKLKLTGAGAALVTITVSPKEWQVSHTEELLAALD